MTKILNLILAISFLNVPNAFAESVECQKGMSEHRSLSAVINDLEARFGFKKLPTCISISQSCDVGTKCRTSQGIAFVRVADGWRDTKGKTWYDEKQSNIGQHESSHAYCKNKGQLLPSKSDFELAESHGIREVFKDMENESRGFWSSTIDNENDGYAYFFDGSIGKIDLVDRDLVDERFFARCVNTSDRNLNHGQFGSGSTR